MRLRCRQNYLSCTSDLAVRLGRAGVSTARAWLAMQSNYDLAQAMKREQPPVRPLDDRAA
ncbi:hypothetical protein ATU3B_23880 [Agrobacterium genomosp. 3 str. CIP 111-78]|uniref:helix-turn-helix transcriptional regulator n=1 Tax=Agrobacterium tumefaciens complex TaxID=1183400 RepID=UPI001AEEDBC4|nr:MULTISPECIES: hypothetical protein [Agrobacterium tumefaciens complex]MCA2374671.1 hypothetical protein [Agrobacterium tomkonis CIP 111-78]